MKYACVLLCVVILAACTVPLHAPQEGGVRITISNGISQRTIMPNYPIFTKYELSFESEVGEHEVVTFEGDTATVTDLAPGEWIITATGYVTIDGEEFPAASGSEEVTVIPGIPADVEITIEAERSPGGDDGFFRYSVSVGSNIVMTRAELSLTPFFSGGGSNGYNKGLADFSEDGLSDFIPLEPGFYLMTIRLASNDGYKTVGLADVVHIYSNMETNWERTFIPADFADAKTYSLSVGLIKEQTGIWGDGEPYGEVYFYIGDDSTEKTTTATFPEDAEVTVTITAQANGIRLNMVGNQDPWFFVLEDNYKGPGVEDFIEDFYVEGDSTVYTGTTAFTKTFTFTITKDITLYAIFNGDGYDRPKNFTADYWAELSPTEQQEMMYIDFALMEDLDLGDEWTPIGGGDTPFTGTFDGRGHTITLAKTINYVNVSLGGMNFGVLSVAGLFGYIGEEGTVKNLILEGSIENKEEDAYNIGALVGYNEGTIINVLSMVTVNNNGACSGGIAAQNSGKILNCVSMGEINGGTSAGGIAGLVYGSTDNLGGIITGCWVSGNINATNLFTDEDRDIIDGNRGIAGGIAGDFYSGVPSVKNCVALSGNVSGGEYGDAGRIGAMDEAIDFVGNDILFNAISFSNNYAFGDMGLDIDERGPTTKHGGDASATDIASKLWWENSPGWTFAEDGKANEANPWVWDNANNRPKLWFVEQ